MAATATATQLACECGDPWWQLVLAGMCGSLLLDLAVNFYVYQRGLRISDDRWLPNRWPLGTGLSDVIGAAAVRSILAGAGVAFLAIVIGAVTTLTAAGTVGIALPEVLASFAGIRVPALTSQQNGLPGEGPPARPGE